MSAFVDSTESGLSSDFPLCALFYQEDTYVNHLILPDSPRYPILYFRNLRIFSSKTKFSVLLASNLDNSWSYNCKNIVHFFYIRTSKICLTLDVPNLYLLILKFLNLPSLLPRKCESNTSAVLLFSTQNILYGNIKN